MASVSHGMLDAGNMIVSAPYYISGKTGTLAGLAAGNSVASLQNLGRVDLIGGGPNIPAPMRLTQLQLVYTPVTTPAANGVAFEVYKTTVTTQHNAGAGSSSKTPTRKKTTGYDAIAATEINLFVAGTAAITGGAHVLQGDPFAMVTAGDLSGGSAVWKPSDLMPITLESGEGCDVRATQFSGTGILLVVFHFVRQ